MFKTIKINKEKKSRLIKFLSLITVFTVLGLSFYLNHKFMNGNNFFDSIILLSFFAVANGLTFDKSYFEVSDEKFKKIEEILNK
jgi:hypothetical protein